MNHIAMTLPKVERKASHQLVGRVVTNKNLICIELSNVDFNGKQYPSFNIFYHWKLLK